MASAAPSLSFSSAGTCRKRMGKFRGGLLLAPPLFAPLADWLGHTHSGPERL